jgi:hypothetical protein
VYRSWWSCSTQTHETKSAKIPTLTIKDKSIMVRRTSVKVRRTKWLQQFHFRMRDAVQYLIIARNESD